VMGKPKSQSAKAKKHAKARAKGAGESSYSIDQLLGKAGDLLDEYNYELAQKFCQRALELDADNVQALEMSGNLLLELGEVEKAQQCLGRAIHLQPQAGHTKYLTAAQLFTGQDSLSLYLKGVEILETCISSASGEGERSETVRALSSALVAVSELYTTDLCDTEGAREEASKAIQRAIEADRGNSEAWEALANFNLITGELEGAQEAMATSLELWLPQHLAFVEKGEGEGTQLSYNSRLNTAKLLMDLENFDRAAEVLDTLLQEDDEVVAPWYLMGWLNLLREDPDYHGNVRHYLNKAKQVHSMNPTDDTGMLEHIDELLAEVGPEPEPEASQQDISVAEPEAVADILDGEGEEESETSEMEQT